MITVRTARFADARPVAAIYGHHVLNGLGTFEEEPPGTTEMASRIEAVLKRGLPYLVAEQVGTVVGFAYASPLRPRAAYRYTVEDSVYVAPDAAGRGVGKAVLGAVLGRCEAMGLRQVMAVIGDSGNAGSIGLHRSLGFEPAGICRSVGFKHGRWVDTVWMQKALNTGDTTDPDAPGLVLAGH